MPDPVFRVESAEPSTFAAAPAIDFNLRVENSPAEESIHAIVLQAQIQIDATRRRYTPGESERLLDLFGEPHRWAQTVRPMLWTLASTVVPAFSGSGIAALRVPCTFDFNLAATKYFDALSDGEIPLIFLFSGSVFYQGPGGELQVCPISWSKEARFQLPVQVWRDMMDHYYPNTAWLCLRRDVFHRLHAYKMKHGIATWEQAIESILETRDEETVVS